LVRVY